MRVARPKPSAHFINNLSGGKSRNLRRQRGFQMTNNERFQERYFERMAELERRGELIMRDPLRFSILHQLSCLQHWQPDHRPN
jgi:hypothetical protein